MANVHNVLIRGINSIYLQAPNIKSPTDISDFLFFIHCYCDLIELHHKSEEDFLFPKIAELAGESDPGQPNLFSKSVDQHNAFHDGLHQLHEYSKTKPEAYSGTKVQEIVNSFAPVLHEHLSDEIEELLELKKLDSAALMKIHKDAEKHKEPEKAEEMFPLFFGLVDKTYEGGIPDFPPMPGFVQFFMPWVLYYWIGRTYKGAWRFLPCDFWRQPRPLEFVD